MPRRVAVTGMGVISALGQSVGEFWDNCLADATAVSEIPEHWLRYSDYKSRIWSTLPQLDFERFGLGRIDILQHDMVSLLSLCAGRQALEHSGRRILEKSRKDRTFEIDGMDPRRAGIYMGTGSFGAHSFLETHTNQILSRPKDRLEARLRDLEMDEDVREEIDSILDTLMHAKRYNPFTVSRLMPNAVSAVLGIKYSFKGPVTTVALACAAGTAAVGQAFRSVRDGRVELALGGGSEYWDDHYGAIFKGFDIANTLVHDEGEPGRANRPFDRDRTGFLFSQGGSAVLVLEELETARRRGADILAEVIGFSESFDAYSMMSLAPEGEEIERMIGDVLADARVGAADIDYINTHGTGTPANDEVESRVIERIFGCRPSVNATKSLLGHTIGASGALEAVVTVLSLRDQATHACRNLTNPISELNFVREPGRCAMEHALTHSFAFGGHNAGLVLKRFDEQ